MTKKQLTLKSVEALKEAYPEAICSLVYSDPLQLLIATRLSAQCTDARVNLVTPELFSKYKTLDDLANAEVEDVEKIIRSCGFYHDKARDIVGIAKKIKSDFNGEVPSTIEELTSLPGVGRKTANLIMGDVFHAPSSVVTDTHLIRISNRIGLVDTKDPKKVEFELRKLLPPDESNDFCHRTVLHGRAVCTARKAHCDICTLKDFCKKKI
ncbi:MAG: endonuclease III [Candidatus Fimenecus sp.]|nr:endonuclease III [Oscillospiraceae bacterium]MCI6388365.1 endonuclease III [Ruminococcus sp.]MDD6270633.1 endonuclease III [Ruminococcus sp.]MDY4909966.1 endonuclease III [Candidatus Fimenecus sp.]MDY6058846.1 endonuclease III [Candidatus Fimenecus sp.]